MRNNLIKFVLQLESIAGEDAKVYIERLEKRVDLINDERDTEPGDGDKVDSFKKIIRQAL